MRSLASQLGVMLTAAALAAPAAAEPQGNASLTIGGAGVGERGRFWEHAAFHLGARGDVMFLRDKPGDFGLGPYVEIGTQRFDEVHFGGGATVLFPVHDLLPLVASAGAFGRWRDDGFGLEPGVSGALFWGVRNFNYTAGYAMAGGLLVAYRQSLGASKESTLLIAAQLDLAAIGLPLVALVNLIRGPTAAARPL